MQSILIAGFAALLACCPGHAWAQANNVTNTVQPPVAAPATSASRTIDPADLAAFVDGVVQTHMRDDGVAGVAVTVVDRQGILLLRGYGIASQKPLRAVDPARTVFRIGSTSKTLAPIRRGGTHAFNEPLAIWLVPPYRCECTRDVQYLTRGRAYGLRICASLSDNAALSGGR